MPDEAPTRQASDSPHGLPRLVAWTGNWQAAVLTAAFCSPAWAQGNPYTYVKMSLLVPWTLYFVFLACVLIPFVLVILLAWKGRPGDDSGKRTTASK